MVKLSANSQRSGTDVSPVHFTGDEHDAESNLEHTPFRQLSTTQGRWLSPDPAGMAAADPTNPQPGTAMPTSPIIR